MERNKSCRASSRNVRVTPEMRMSPDIEKLARALVSIAKGLAEKLAEEGQSTANDAGEGDGVP